MVNDRPNQRNVKKGEKVNQEEKIKKLSSEQRKLVTENLKLVNYCLKFSANSSNYDELLLQGQEGLVKAALSYKEEKKVKFSVYALRCIQNEINMYYRSNKKFKKNISLNAVVSYNDNGEELCLGDIIEDGKQAIDKRLETREDLICLLSKILNNLSGMERQVMLCEVAELAQWKTGSICNVTQACVSRWLKLFREKIIMDDTAVYEKTVDVEILKGEKLRFTFSDFGIINLENVENLKENVEIIFNENSIVIEMSMDTENFVYLAKIIEKKQNKKNSKVEKIRKYIYSKDFFTVGELKTIFPGCNSEIANALRLDKRKGYIKSEGRGSYTIVTRKN